MKVELKDFQSVAARAILDELEEARESVARGKLQAVVLSAPTGSGKTITIASVIDLTFGGGDGVLARPDTVFLWLSDSPELNAQSKGKLLNACDNLPFHELITIESESFDEERLYPGRVYFINTQLLGKDKLLTKEGDRRYTFWQTVANTVSESSQNFILIIDEAHRGAAANDKNRTPIMQKFIRGSEEDNLPPVPLVLGMSATPQRFTTLLGNTNRITRPINITPEDVRSSGLLKDMIIVHNPKDAGPSDLTMLEEAARRWKQFTKLWEEYCRKENEKEVVRPILVVQVEDGSENTITRSPLGDIVRVIERQTGTLDTNEIVHCFNDQSDIQIGDRIIRKIEASRIQDSPEVKVVLFKTALSTGWDCPRAETMMSFRRAQDPTSIAQLVGRMIRTPLARRIATNEVLDTVELFLPHYKSEALETVLARLRSPEAEEGVPTRVETTTEEYPRNPKLAEIFEHLKTLPTYSISRAPKMGEVKRALRLAGMLVHEGVDKDADDAMRDTFTKKLKELRDQYAGQGSEWSNLVREGGEITVDVSLVSIGEMTIAGQKEMRLILSEENINRLFEASGRKLAAGEGLHHSYWRRYHNQDKPNEAKLELFAIIRQPNALTEMEKLAGREFKTFWEKHKGAIQQLQAAERSRFSTLLQASGNPVRHEWELAEKIVEKKSGEAWKEHLYCNAEGEFWSKLNSWEKALLTEAMDEEGFVAWLRNHPRRDWAYVFHTS
jgi:type III restriction enzyme